MPILPASPGNLQPEKLTGALRPDNARDLAEHLMLRFNPPSQGEYPPEGFANVRQIRVRGTHTVISSGCAAASFGAIDRESYISSTIVAV